jgi:very-short-patch-repair endonuclease
MKVTRIKPLTKQRSRKLRKEMTDAESRLWKEIRKKQLHGYKFRRQYPVGNYVLDFVCLNAGLVIEIDGGQHQESFAYDQKRTLWLEQQGYRVLRFWNNEVLYNIYEVLEVICNELRIGN